MNYKSYLVKKERIKNNYSIEDLAKIANTSKSHISRIENGRILSDDIALSKTNFILLYSERLAPVCVLRTVINKSLLY